MTDEQRQAMLAARYPPKPPPPKRWCGWRRPREKFGTPWERVEESDAPTKGECYQTLMELSELRGPAPETPWQYAICPEGASPP